MTQLSRQLNRDEVRLPTGDIVQIVANDIWVEFESAVDSDTENTVVAQYQINDIVTDAVNVTVTDAEPLENGDQPVADYEWGEFRSNVESGHLIPRSILTDEYDLNPDEDLPEVVLVDDADGLPVAGEDNSGNSPDAEAIVEAMAEASNPLTIDPEDLMQQFDDQHNYLQKEMFHGIVKPLILAAATTSQYDRRNETVREQARTIADTLDWELPNDRRT